MNRVYTKITLDVNDMTSQASLSVKRGDTVRSLLVTLVDNNQAYIIPDECYAVFSAKKDNGKFVSDGCTIKKNQITYDFSDALVSEMGKFDCDITIYGKDKERLTCAMFNIFVYDAIVDEYSAEVVDSDEFYTLGNLIQTANSVIEECREVTDEGKKVNDNLRSIPMVVGENADPSEDSLFTVGNGDNDTDPSNAMEVLKDGTVVAKKFVGEASTSADSLKFTNGALLNAGTDLNDIVDGGFYRTGDSENTATIKNTPNGIAGEMHVISGLGECTIHDGTTWVNRIQVYTNHTGEVYIRRIIINNGAKTIFPWNRYLSTADFSAPVASAILPGAGWYYLDFCVTDKPYSCGLIYWDGYSYMASPSVRTPDFDAYIYIWNTGNMSVFVYDINSVAYERHDEITIRCRKIA